MANFVIAHDTSGHDFLINLDNVECFRSEKDGNCSAKLVSGHVIYLNARLTDVQRTLKEREEEGKTSPFSFLHIYAEHLEHVLERKKRPLIAYISRPLEFFKITVKSTLWNILQKRDSQQSLEVLYTIRDSNPRHPD